MFQIVKINSYDDTHWLLIRLITLDSFIICIFSMWFSCQKVAHIDKIVIIFLNIFCGENRCYIMWMCLWNVFDWPITCVEKGTKVWQYFKSIYANGTAGLVNGRHYIDFYGFGSMAQKGPSQQTTLLLSALRFDDMVPIFITLLGVYKSLS